MARASKTAVRAAGAWRLVVLGAMLAAGAAIVRQQQEIDDLRARLEARVPVVPVPVPAPSPAPAEVFVAPSPAASAPAEPAVAFDLHRQSEQHYLSGVIFFQKGDYVKAREEWLLAKQADPSNEDAAAGLQRIDSLYAGQ